MAAPSSLFSLPAGYTIRPASPATCSCLAMILPVFLFTSMSATQPRHRVRVELPNAMPRPVTTLALERFEAATLRLPVRVLRHVGEHVLPPLRDVRNRLVGVAMFWSRNATGSIFATYASSSISLLGGERRLRGVRRPQERRLEVVVLQRQALPDHRRFGMLYCEPLIVVSDVARTSSRPPCPVTCCCGGCVV